MLHLSAMRLSIVLFALIAGWWLWNLWGALGVRQGSPSPPLVRNFRRTKRPPIDSLEDALRTSSPSEAPSLPSTAPTARPSMSLTTATPPTPAPTPPPTSSPTSPPIRCATAPQGGPFVFDAPTVELVRNPTVGTVVAPTRPSLHPDLLAGFRRNHRPAYQSFGAGDWAGFVSGGHDVTRSRVARLRNVWVDAQGWIVDAQTCAAVKNGGCVTTAPFTIPSSAPPSYGTVTTLAGKWTGGIWHFPMEALVGLAALEDEDEVGPVHVSDANDYVVQWLAMVGIPKERVVDGTIHALELVVPEMGKCGTPSPHQLEWLATKVRHAVGTNAGVRNAVVLVKRTKSRTLGNFDRVATAVRSYAEARGLSVYVHDDSNLPSVVEQLQRFAEAVVVVAPHGAGLVNLIALPNDTTVVEFMDPGQVNACYTRLASLLGHQYHGIPVRGGMVDVAALEVVLAASEGAPPPVRGRPWPTGAPDRPPNALRFAPRSEYLDISLTTLWASHCGRSATSPRCSERGDMVAAIDRESSAALSEARARCERDGVSPCRFYSQMQEDATVYNAYFADVRGGTYLELGALDGTLYSNTRFLQDSMGWSGVLVEASPPSFQKLVHARGGAKNTLYHRAVCERSGTVTFYGTDARAGIAGLFASGTERPGQLEQEIQCEPLRDLLHRAGTKQLDFWSLDVEGGELGVLRSMDWSIPVHVLVIERNSNDLAIEALLLGLGFDYVREQRGNRVWVNPAYPAPPSQAHA